MYPWYRLWLLGKPVNQKNKPFPFDLDHYIPSWFSKHDNPTNNRPIMKVYLMVVIANDCYIVLVYLCLDFNVKEPTYGNILNLFFAFCTSMALGYHQQTLEQGCNFDVHVPKLNFYESSGLFASLVSFSPSFLHSLLDFRQTWRWL